MIFDDCIIMGEMCENCKSYSNLISETKKCLRMIKARLYKSGIFLRNIFRKKVFYRFSVFLSLGVLLSSHPSLLTQVCTERDLQAER